MSKNSGERLQQAVTTTLIKTDRLEVIRLVLPAGKEIADQIRTDVLIVEDEPFIALDLQSLVPREEERHALAAVVLDVALAADERPHFLPSTVEVRVVNTLPITVPPPLDARQVRHGRIRSGELCDCGEEAGTSDAQLHRLRIVAVDAGEVALEMPRVLEPARERGEAHRAHAAREGEEAERRPARRAARPAVTS